MPGILFQNKNSSNGTPPPSGGGVLFKNKQTEPIQQIPAYQSITKQHTLEPGAQQQVAQTTEGQQWYKDHPVLDKLAHNPVSTFLDTKIAPFFDVLGSNYRKMQFGDTEKVPGRADTTGNKTADTIANTIGMIGAFTKAGTGGVGFGGPVNKVSQAITNKLIPTTTNLLQKAGKRATQGAIESVPYSAQQIATQPEITSPGEALRATAGNALLGVGAELGLMGAGGLISAITKKLKGGQTLTQAEKEVVQKTPELQKIYVDQYGHASTDASKVPQLALPAPAKPEPFTQVKYSTQRTKPIPQKGSQQAGEGIANTETIHPRFSNDTFKNTGGKLYREVGTDRVESYFDPSAHDAGYGASADAIPVSKSPELALGQGENKGIMLQFSDENVPLLKNTNKPFNPDDGEFFVDAGTRDMRDNQKSLRKNLEKITINKNLLGDVTEEEVALNRTLAIKKAAFNQRTIRLIKNKGWTESYDKEGNLTFTRPGYSDVVPKSGSRQVGQGIASTKTILPRKPQQTLFNANPNIEQPFKATPGELPRAAKQQGNIDFPLQNKAAANGAQAGKKTSQFRTNTIARSTAIPDEVKAKMNPNEFDYIPETSKGWQDEAVNNVSQNRDKVMQDIQNAPSISGGVQAHEAAIVTTQLLDEMKSTGNVSALKGWLKTVAEKTRETARALKGTDTAWDKKSAEGALTDAQRVVNEVENEFKKTNPNLINKINKETSQKIKELTDLGQQADPEQIRDFVKQKYHVPTLTDEDIKFIVDNMEKAKTFPDGSYDQRMFRAKVAKSIANKVPSDMIDKVKAAQRILMLLNPKTTLVRNPLGNTLLGALESTKNIPGAAIDAATTGVRNLVRKSKGLEPVKRTTIIAPLTKGAATAKGAGKGLKEWALDIKNGVDTNPTGAGVEMPKNKIFSENHNISNPKVKAAADFGGKTANFVHTIVGKMLSLGDRPFYEGGYASRIAELKKINKTSVVTDEMKQAAIEQGLERTLQNDSWLSKKISSWGVKKDDPFLWKLFVNLLMPFKKTPANILDKFIDYSPAGAFKAAGHAIGTAGKGTFNQKKFVDTLARSLTGTGLVVVGYLLAKNGTITGARDKNNKVEGIETALGKQNYAWNTGDTYQTYDWALPAAAPIAMGADIYNAVNKTQEGQNAFLKGTESAVNLLFNSTLLQGPSRLMGGYSPAASIAQAIIGSTTQATPTAGKQAAQLIDPYQRETYDPNGLKQTINKSTVRIPYASKTLPAKQSVFGEDIKAFQGKNNAWNVMFNPGFSTTYKPDATQSEIMRLYNESGQSSQIPAVADKSFKWRDQTLQLAPQEFTQFQKTMGQQTMSEYKKVMVTPEYQNVSDTDKAKMLSGVISDAKTAAQYEILKGRGLASVPEVMSVPTSFTEKGVKKSMTFDQQNELANLINKYKKQYGLNKNLTPERAEQAARDRAYAEMKAKLYRNK